MKTISPHQIDFTMKTIMYFKIKILKLKMNRKKIILNFNTFSYTESIPKIEILSFQKIKNNNVDYSLEIKTRKQIIIKFIETDLTTPLIELNINNELVGSNLFVGETFKAKPIDEYINIVFRFNEKLNKNLENTIKILMF